MPRRDGEVFRFGTAMVLLSLQLLPGSKKRAGLRDELKAWLIEECFS
jgi:hypothetical protein